MFEKEAEEWAIDYVCKDCSRYKECKSKEHCTCKDCSKEKWQNGAEFGYNKAKEEIEKLRELVSDCLFYCDHIDPYYNECLTEDNIFERAKKLGIDEE